MNKNRIDTQIKYIEEVIAELDSAYDNREDDFLLHSLFGRALGALKGVHDTLEDINRNA